MRNESRAADISHLSCEDFAGRAEVARETPKDPKLFGDIFISQRIDTCATNVVLHCGIFCCYSRRVSNEDVDYVRYIARTTISFEWLRTQLDTSVHPFVPSRANYPQ